MMKPRIDRSVYRAMILARAYAAAEDAAEVSLIHLFRGAVAERQRSVGRSLRPSVRHLKRSALPWTYDAKSSLARAGRAAKRRSSSTITLSDLLVGTRDAARPVVDAYVLVHGIDPDLLFTDEKG